MTNAPIKTDPNAPIAVILTPNQLKVLRAGWTFFKEHPDSESAMHDALELTNEQRNLNDEGNPTDDYDESNDPVVTGIAEVDLILMNS